MVQVPENINPEGSSAQTEKDALISVQTTDSNSFFEMAKVIGQPIAGTLAFYLNAPK